MLPLVTPICNVTGMSNAPEVPLRVITPADARASIARARRHLEQAAAEIAWQHEMESHRTLAYRSWGAMRDAEYEGVAFMIPSKSNPGWQGIDVGEPEVTRSCPRCGRGMSGRVDRRYCSPACRQGAYRDRKG